MIAKPWFVVCVFCRKKWVADRENACKSTIVEAKNRRSGTLT